jgi:hypothetical protein
MLYLGTTVLILFDLSYLSRFWTQFEAWLGMQFATPNGLKSAVGTVNARYHIVCIQNAAAQADAFAKVLTDQWATKTPQQAFDFLSKPDVTVTNQSDKEGQLPKIMALDATMQGAFQAVMEREGLAGFDELHVQIPERASSASEHFYQGFHPGITCGRSGMKSIVGMRFHLRGSEPSYDLCQAAYDKLDDAEKGLYEAIPPPPPGLKLEGDLLPGEAAKYPGTYRLDGSKLVNGRPAYQHTSDGTLWIAFDGVDSWRGQSESVLGQNRSILKLIDPAAASPDVSTETWKATAGGAGAAWVEAPQLKCTAWTPPPPGLKLEGGSLPGDAAAYMGGYRLIVGKLVNGRPAYQHTSDAFRWIAFDGDSWMVQTESSLGEKKGFLELRDAAAASPDVSTKTWKATVGRAGFGWVEAPQLKCTAWTPPPPPGLKLKGGSLTGYAACYPGTYRLVVGKLVKDRPAYQHTSDASRWIAFDGAGWSGQHESYLGKKGFLFLQDSAAASPDVSIVTWKANAGGEGAAWVEVPQLKCTAWTPPPPPPGLKLEGGSLPGKAAKYPGTYRLVVGKLVNGRPAYQHTSDATLWITFTGNGWMGQHESELGEKKGFLELLDPAAASPDVSTKTWKANAGGAGSGWVEAPQLKCTACTPPPPPPPGLKLEGGSLEGGAAEYMGEYRLAVYDRVWPLQEGKAGWRGRPILVNGRPAWRHTTHLTCWLAFDGANWRGQPEASLGQKSGVLLLSDEAALSPDASSATWLAASGPGSAGAAQPQLKCIPCAAPPLSQVELEELPVKHFRGPCAARCKPLAQCCCVSADGEKLYGCIPARYHYFLPLGLHVCMCPQMGCQPCPYIWGPFAEKSGWIPSVFNSIFLCQIQMYGTAGQDGQEGGKDRQAQAPARSEERFLWVENAPQRALNPRASLSARHGPRPPAPHVGTHR